MISSLRGELIARTLDEVVIECGGVGYGALVSLRTMDQLPTIGDQAFLLIQTIVREDAITLYGFHDAAEREIFVRMTSVSGIGPKIGLAALSMYNAHELQMAIVQEDLAALTRISGVGKKTGQRIILELSGPMKRTLPQTSSTGTIIQSAANHFTDLELALSGLGYKPKDVLIVLDTLKAEEADNADLQQLLRKALKLLQRG